MDGELAMVTASPPSPASSQHLGILLSICIICTMAQGNCSLRRYRYNSCRYLQHSHTDQSSTWVSEHKSEIAKFSLQKFRWSGAGQGRFGGARAWEVALSRKKQNESPLWARVACKQRCLALHWSTWPCFPIKYLNQYSDAPNKILVLLKNVLTYLKILSSH